MVAWSPGWPWQWGRALRGLPPPSPSLRSLLHQLRPSRPPRRMAEDSLVIEWRPSSSISPFSQVPAGAYCPQSLLCMGTEWAFSPLHTSDTWKQRRRCHGASSCTVGVLAASLASSHSMSGARPQLYQPKKSPDIADVPWEAESAAAENPWPKEIGGTVPLLDACSLSWSPELMPICWENPPQQGQDTTGVKGPVWTQARAGISHYCLHCASA